MLHPRLTPLRRIERPAKGPICRVCRRRKTAGTISNENWLYGVRTSFTCTDCAPKGR